MIFSRKIEKYKRKLVLRKDFSIDDAFASIDFLCEGYITKYNIERYIKAVNGFLLEEDLESIFSRMVPFGVRRIDMVTFAKCILPRQVKKPTRPPSRQQSVPKLRQVSSLRKSPPKRVRSRQSSAQSTARKSRRSAPVSISDLNTPEIVSSRVFDSRESNSHSKQNTPGLRSNSRLEKMSMYARIPSPTI